MPPTTNPKPQPTPPPKPTQPTILYYSKTMFGRTDRFLHDSAQAIAFKKMTGRKCLSDDDMALLEAWGLRFEKVDNV